MHSQNGSQLQRIVRLLGKLLPVAALLLVLAVVIPDQVFRARDRAQEDEWQRQKQISLTMLDARATPAVAPVAPELPPLPKMEPPKPPPPVVPAPPVPRANPQPQGARAGGSPPIHPDPLRSDPPVVVQSITIINPAPSPTPAPSPETVSTIILASPSPEGSITNMVSTNAPPPTPQATNQPPPKLEESKPKEERPVTNQPPAKVDKQQPPPKRPPLNQVPVGPTTQLPPAQNGIIRLSIP